MERNQRKISLVPSLPANAKAPFEMLMPRLSLQKDIEDEMYSVVLLRTYRGNLMRYRENLTSCKEAKNEVNAMFKARLVEDAAANQLAALAAIAVQSERFVNEAIAIEDDTPVKKELESKRYHSSEPKRAAKKQMTLNAFGLKKSFGSKRARDGDEKDEAIEIE